MRTKSLSKDDVQALVATLMRERKVMAPVQQDGIHRFEWLEDGQALSLPPGGIPKVSMKSALLPRTEVLFYYKLGKNTEATAQPPAPEPQVLFGVHPCDVQAIKVLDAVFGAEPYPDSLYLARREATTIIGLGLPRDRTPHSAFFERLGIGSMDNRDCDLFLADLDSGHFLLEVLTEKGEALADTFDSLLDASEGDLARLEELRIDAAAHVTADIDVADLKGRLATMFEAEMWQKVAERCVGCGACSYLCPTCHCFDIQDESHGNVGCRVRNWDTCQFDLFTKHASGHNPRTEQQQRARQRIMHKYEYGYANFGIPFCTGCGRCVLACPMHSDIRNILQEIQEQPLGT